MRKTPKLTELVYRKGKLQWNAWRIKIHAINIGTLVLDKNGPVGAGKTAEAAGRDLQKQWRAKQRKIEAEIQKDILNG